MKRRLVLVLVVLLLPVAAAVGGLLALIVTAPVTPRVHVAPAADPTGAAVQALRDDDPLLALAYLAQVPSDDLNYGWAQRATARVQVERLGQPAAGLGPALAAVARRTGRELAHARLDGGRSVPTVRPTAPVRDRQARRHQGAHGRPTAHHLPSR